MTEPKAMKAVNRARAAEALKRGGMFMIQPKAMKIVNQVRKAIIGKDAVICRGLMAILAQGHILLEDNPGVGKTTLALAFARAMGLTYNRIQFTPEVMPADVVGFSVYSKASESFEYRPGAAMCNLLLADEINRTSAKTQSALLEAMEEGQVTVDGVSHRLPQPFVVIATQNPVGSAGTQLLPESQLDRFMMRLSLGYPALDQEIQVLKQTEGARPVDSIVPAVTMQEVLEIQQEVAAVHVSDELYLYVAKLCAATREQDMLRLGASPRAGGALIRACRASAWMSGRDYVIPADVQLLFFSVLEHRLSLDPQARISGATVHSVLTESFQSVPAPKLV